MAVGKSSILSQYTKKTFPNCPLPTIAIEFASKIIKTKEGDRIKVQIWDTAGQEKYKSITSHHYRKAVGAMLIYDITRRSTFDNLMKWYSELKNYAEKDCVIFLIGNKIDLLHQNANKREVPFEEAEKVSKDNKMVLYETSAKNNHNIETCFEELIKRIYDERKTNGNLISKNSVMLTNDSNKDKDNHNKEGDIGCC